jgi:hypothetical protein
VCISGLDDCIYWHLIHITRYYRRCSAIADLHTLQFTVSSLVVSWQRIYNSPSLQIAHEVHRLILFFPLFCNCQFQRLDSIQFLCSQAHILAGWRFEHSTHFYTAAASFGTLLHNHFARSTQKTQHLYSWKGMLTAPLHSNGSYSIVACLFIAAGMCLPSRCLAMNPWLRYSDFRALCHSIIMCVAEYI